MSPNEETQTACVCISFAPTKVTAFGAVCPVGLRSPTAGVRMVDWVRQHVERPVPDPLPGPPPKWGRKITSRSLSFIPKKTKELPFSLLLCFDYA